MALVTEIGNGDSTAESLCSVAFADTYHADRGNVAWAALATTAIKEQNLRKATEYMFQVFSRRWTGYRMTYTQALDWPRDYVPRVPALTGTLYYANNTVPVEVQRACAELALKASSADLLADLTQQKISVTIGPIQTTYDKNSQQTKRYASIEAMLSPYFAHAAGAVQVIRA